MTRAELRQFVRGMTLVEAHEANDFLIDQFLLEGYHKVIHRRNWSWRRKRLAANVEAGGLYVDLHQFDPGPILPPRTRPANRRTPGITAIADLRVDTSDGMFESAWNQVTLSEVTFYGDERSLWWQGVERSYYFDPHEYMVIFSEELDTTSTVVLAVFYSPIWYAGDLETPPLIPEHNQLSTIANFAIHRLWERQEDLDRSDAYLGRFEMGLGDLLYEENTRNPDRPKIYGELAHRGRRWGNMPWINGVGGPSGGEEPPFPQRVFHVVDPDEPVEPEDGLLWTDPDEELVP